VPYSGPASAYGTIGKSEAAYFAMINDQGGINGRKVNFLSRDDSYSPPKTVEVVRKLVEEDQVLLMFGTLGTPPNTAIQGYLNDNKVPQLFVTTGANKWNDPKHHPWTMGCIEARPVSPTERPVSVSPLNAISVDCTRAPKYFTASF
jgi:branched-chain amino acid transport system substrate-binding protein